MDQITQGHAGLHAAFEAHQHRLRHIQRHHAGGRAKSHQTRACRKADTDGEAGVAVAACTHGVGQQQAVQPGMDHPIARAQSDATAVGHKGRQLVVHLHVHGFGVGCGVAERLHHQIGAKAQASQVFELVTRHRAGGVLGAHRGHTRLAIRAGAHALAFGQTHCASDHFLRQGETGLRGNRRLWQAEQSRGR